MTCPTARLLASLAALSLTAAPALAAKAKFERTKPHVNVGTIGPVPSTIKRPAQLTTVPAAPVPDRRGPSHRFNIPRR